MWGAVALAAGALSGCDAPAAPSVSISEFRLGPAPPGAQARAAYLTVLNRGDRPRTLVTASSSAYEVVEFHRTETVNEVSSMRREDRVVIAPGERVVFEPFGRHLMLMVPRTRTEEKTSVPVTVTVCFADGECVELTEES